MMWRRVKRSYPQEGWAGWIKVNSYGVKWTAVSANGAHETYHDTLAHAAAWLRTLE